MSEAAKTIKTNLGVFHVSCWMLGLVAFVQLMSVGVALALKGTVQPEVETKVVTEYVVVPRPTPVRVTPPKDAPKKVAVEVPDLEPLALPDLEELDVPATPRVMDVAPPIKNPIVERLIEEAREARIKGDLVLAQTKLNEATHLEGDNANVLYELAMNYDSLRLYDRGVEYYMMVRNMGPIKAGSLYAKASAKIERGRIEDLKDLASLGLVRKSAPKRVAGGERRTVMLPISVAPGKDFDPELLDPRMNFFEEVDGKIQPAVITPDGSGFAWVSEPVNWDDGEELAEVWYFVPDQDAREAYYSGERKFYGMVVELYYDGRLVDLMAQPRTLIKEMSYSKSSREEWDPDLSPILEAMDNFDNNGTLLPPQDALDQGLPSWDDGPQQEQIPVPVVPETFPNQDQ
ncbi:hypothetical protein N9A94_06725 [Akkermansiaceae bacterium]|nr:hypothetical protein [Akkermansiaceae bacterium]MDA7888518.1 hypothetical protein [Akkermansiaceae bacterium]